MLLVFLANIFFLLFWLEILPPSNVLAVVAHKILGVPPMIFSFIGVLLEPHFGQTVFVRIISASM